MTWPSAIAFSFFCVSVASVLVVLIWSINKGDEDYRRSLLKVLESEDNDK